MARLTISTNDFTLEFASAKVNDVCLNAVRTLGTEALYSHYVAKGEPIVSLAAEEIGVADFMPSDPDLRVSKYPFFFDNVDYDVWISFENDVGGPRLVHEAREVEAELTSHSSGGRQVLTGKINFNNDIGKHDFALAYNRGGAAKTFCLTFHVLSSKLDYHHDWPKLVEEIENEYRLLSFDHLRRTYHSFDKSPVGETSDLIWWNLFKAECTSLFSAAELILNRPRRRLTRTAEYRRADRLTLLSPTVEEAFAEHKGEVGYRYRVEREDMTHDTPENRFFKHALRTIAEKHRRLGGYIKDRLDKRVSESEIVAIDAIDRRFTRLVANPFFRGVGPYEGLKQTSMVLQQAAGYAAVARIYAILKASYAIHEGLLRLQTKGIDELYEMWCFLTVKNIVKGSFDPDVEIAFNFGEMNTKFVKDLPNGSKSRVVFRAQDGTELAEVAYNAKAMWKGGKDFDAHTKIVTGVTNDAHERPDIVLRLTKPMEGQSDFKLTYLFDAKYRIAGRYSGHAFKTVDYPPQDAIDQMHRYRDAIYYEQTNASGGSELKKEVIGGYILFPGNGEKTEVQNARFMESRKKVNIGAFPLKPGGDTNREFLEEFIKELISGKDAVEQVLSVKPQKGTAAVVESDANPAASVQIIRYEGGITKDLIVQEGYCPCESEILKDKNPNQIKMLVFPHVRGGEAFVVDGKPIGPISVLEFKTRLPAFDKLTLKTDEVYYWKVKLL